MSGPFDDCIEDASVDAMLTRFEASSVSKGRVQVAPVASTSCIRASITPLPYKEIMQLPEGTLRKGAKLVISTCELFTAITSECRLADRIAYLGASYQIHSVADWSDLGGYYAYTAVRLGQ